MRFSNFISSCTINLLVIWQLIVPGFTHLLVHKRKKKNRVYTPMVGSPTINVVVYTNFGGSSKLKV